MRWRKARVVNQRSLVIIEHRRYQPTGHTDRCLTGRNRRPTAPRHHRRCAPTATGGKRRHTALTPPHQRRRDSARAPVSPDGNQAECGRQCPPLGQQLRKPQSYVQCTEFRGLQPIGAYDPYHTSTFPVSGPLRTLEKTRSYVEPSTAADRLLASCGVPGLSADFRVVSQDYFTSAEFRASAGGPFQATLLMLVGRRWDDKGLGPSSRASAGRPWVVWSLFSP